MQVSLKRRIAPSVLFLIACLVALSVAGAVERAPLPRVVQFEHGGVLYKLDFTDFYEKRLSFALDGGCYQVSISKGSLNHRSVGQPFDQDDLQAVRILDGPLRAEAASWNEVFARTTCLDDREFTIRDEAGPDRFEFNIPRVALMVDVGDIPDGVMATVSVNGHLEELEPALLYQLATGVAAGAVPPGVEIRPEFTNLAWHYSADGWYHRALPVFQEMQAVVGDRYEIPEMGGSLSTSACTIRPSARTSRSAPATWVTTQRVIRIPA